MPDRLSRLAPLTGVVFGALTVAAIFSGGETPDANASVAKVLTYYGSHRSGVETSAIQIAFAFLCFWCCSPARCVLTCAAPQRQRGSPPSPC
jgi:hypothetical protein